MSRKQKVLITCVVLVIIAACVARRAPGAYWSWRSSNPVRRGVQKARALGCFHCHGELGSAGLPDPGTPGDEVPPWTGGTWMMYVKDDADVREFILDGRRHSQESGDIASSGHEIRMPAYREVISASDVDDLVAAYAVLSGMSLPAADSSARKGYELARTWNCFACHGPGGSGGLDNPRSFTGFVPGWYGADFHDLVRDRAEFDEWLTRGQSRRLAENRVAAWFFGRQRIRMPRYTSLSAAERDALWEYTRWLDPNSR